MNYYIDTISDFDNSPVIITDKTHKNKTIVIKLDSTIKEFPVYNGFNLIAEYRLKLLKDKINISNKIQDKDGYNLYENNKELTENEQDIILHELVNIILKNNTIADCDYLNSIIYNLHQEYVNYEADQKGVFVRSNIPIDAYCELMHQGKIILTASRIIMSDSVTLLESVNKNEITEEMIKESTLKVFLNNKVFELRVNSNSNILFSEEAMIKYINGDFSIINVFEANKDINIEYLNVPKMFRTEELAQQHIKKHNTTEQIVKYRMSMIPKVKLIDTDKFLVYNFTI